jgi:hypothetical protein
MRSRETRGRVLLLAAALTAAGALTGAAGFAADAAHAEHKAMAAPGATTKDFEKIKKLAGEWTMDGQGDQVAVTYRVTAQGSAVVETLFPGAPYEMVTVYHMDGNTLMLTHYCGDGNQPRMKAAPGAGPNQIVFKFAGATGMKSPKDPHMHDATFTFVDDDHVQAAWTSYKDGKKEDVKEFKLTRKK